MVLNAGERLGPYEILAPLGAGGMGEVYRARDNKLGREVAIKVLPEEFSQHPQKLARFEREARLLATLNHPGIATIYEVEESEGKPFLVMELVEGETLAERISRGPVPVGEALEISRQIAEALEAAHEKGVIHRDLKPANIKVDPEGKVKVLDFGLAKAFADEVPESELSQSPTLSRDATRAGVILGTAAYMSPEQAKGKTVDKRSDIFSFGIVLYEMLTGKRAFAGEDVSDVLASIIKLDIDWKALPSNLDPRIRKLLTRCLKPDRKKRLRDVGDVRNEIEEILAEPTAATTQQPFPVSPSNRARERAVWATGTIVMALITGVVVWGLMRPAPPPISRFPLTLPPDVSFTGLGRHIVALSPDGTRLVYVASEQLYLREMDQMEAVPIRGTDMIPREPFFSPDSEWVGFYAGGNLRKVSVTGGAPVTLCEATNPTGASWGLDDTIVFGQGAGGILQVSANGGTPEVLVSVDSEKGERAHGPQMLPDGKTVLFTLATTGSWDESQIVTQSLETGERRVLMEGGSDGRYVPTGHLVYALGETLLAVPFDLTRLTVTGGPVPVVEGVGRAAGVQTGAAHASFSDSGSLVYIPAESATGMVYNRELVWVDRQGVEEPESAALRAYRDPRVSPDGQRVAVGTIDDPADVWVLERGRGTLTRLTFGEGGNFRPFWTPDGERVIFASSRDEGTMGVFSIPADGSGTVEQLTKGAYRVPTSITADGKTIVFRQNSDGASRDIGIVRLEGESEPELLLQTPFEEHTGMLSPDDRWLAYVSDESGREQVYVTPFPGAGSKWQISIEGGVEPHWSRDGRELFYRNGQKMMVVSVAGAEEFTAGKPTVLFEGPYEFGADQGANPGSNYDVAPDGRFLMIRVPESPSETSAPRQRVNVVLNWFEELKRLAPTN